MQTWGVNRVYSWHPATTYFLTYILFVNKYYLSTYYEDTFKTSTVLVAIVTQEIILKISGINSHLIVLTTLWMGY